MYAFKIIYHALSRQSPRHVYFELFFEWANTGLFFIYYVFFKHTLQILQQIGMSKMSIRYTVLGFELTTFGT